MKKFKLSELIILSKNGEITFDITSHRLIPNNVLLNGAIIGESTISSIKAFKKQTNKP